MDSSARTQIIPSLDHMQLKAGSTSQVHGAFQVASSVSLESSIVSERYPRSTGRKVRLGFVCRAVGEVGSTSVASGGGANKLVLIMVVTAALGGLLFSYYR
jgi:hypothetical protein